MECRALHLVARELQIGPHLRVARGQLCSLAIRGNRAAEIAGLEFRVAVIEIERRGNRLGLKNFFVSGGGVGKFALGIKFVRGVEFSRSRRPSRCR